MLAQLKTVVLIKEVMKLAFFRLVEYLEHLWVWLQVQNGQKQNNFLLKLVSLFLFWEMKAIPCEKLPRNCLCSFAHLNLLFVFASLKYGFFFATLLRRPASRSCLFTVDVETGVLRVLFNKAASLHYISDQFDVI